MVGPLNRGMALSGPPRTHSSARSRQHRAMHPASYPRVPIIPSSCVQPTTKGSRFTDLHARCRSPRTRPTLPGRHREPSHPPHRASRCEYAGGQSTYVSARRGTEEDRTVNGGSEGAWISPWPCRRESVAQRRTSPVQSVVASICPRTCPADFSLTGVRKRSVAAEPKLLAAWGSNRTSESSSGDGPRRAIECDTEPLAPRFSHRVDDHSGPTPGMSPYQGNPNVERFSGI